MGSFSGYTLCANILTYSSSENNRGSIADKIIVESYFGSKVNFQTNYIREDPQNNGFITKDRFERELDNAIAITKEKRYPTLIVVIASHGSEVNVNGKLQQHVDFYDETVSIDDVLFKKLWDSDLENVEKIVWLEMCRVYPGNNDDTMIDVGISIKLVNDVKAERFGPANENADANVNVTEHINPNLPPNCVMLFGAPSVHIMGSFSGYTLCANILTYSSSENNRGSIADKIIVESYFGSKVNFQTNYIREDPQNNGFITKDRFERELDNAIAITKEKRYPTLIVVIASHGSGVNVNGKLQQHVDFYDETVSIDDVLFKKLWDSDLENVEKIVWLEMCRVYSGNNDTMIDVGISIKLVNDVKAERFGPANENADANVNVTEHINPNLPPNCVMLFGAPSGKYSYTNPSTGSHSLLALKTVMQGTRRNEEISVLSLLTKVIWDMSKHNFEADLGDENNPVIKHLSNNGSVIHRLTKEMKLNIVKD